MAVGGRCALFSFVMLLKILKYKKNKLAKDSYELIV